MTPSAAHFIRSRSTTVSSARTLKSLPGPSRPRPPSPVQSVPPDYPPEGVLLQPPPVYNSRPAPNEDTLLSGALPPPDNVYTRRSKQITLALTGQERPYDAGESEEPDLRPCYGKGATVAGVVELNERNGLKLADVLQVSLTIQGKLKLEIAEGGQSSQSFLDHTIPLYPSPSHSTSTQQPPCPSMLSFSYPLPLTFDEDSPRTANDPVPPPGPVQRQLPPSYLVQYDGIPGIRAQVKYYLKVNVERKRFWNIRKNHSLRVGFDYVPRSRPHLPGPSQFASFIAAVKQTPEEWVAFINDIPRREDPTNRETHQHNQNTALANGETITSSLVLPSTQTFPLTQAIPFHLQLSLSSSPIPKHDPIARHHTHPPRRPKTAPQPTTLQPIAPPLHDPNPNLLSLFTDPEFTAPPTRGRRRANTTNAIVGLGEGIAGDGAMYGDPRYGNTGRGDLNLPGRQMSPSPSPSPATRVDDEAAKKSYVRVFLQRQIVITVKGQKVVKTIACGDGRLHRVRLDNPPEFGDHSRDARSVGPGSWCPAPSTITVPGGIDGVDHIGWEGFVIPSKEILSVGGFRTSGLWVKDFITLSMVPPDPEHSPLRTLHHAVPVKLVSDPWEEEWWTGRRW